LRRRRGSPNIGGLTYARFAVALLRGEFRAAGEIAEAYLRQAEVEARPEHVVAARRMLGAVKFELGRFSESREEFERMLANWDEERDKDLRVLMGSDVLCFGWSYMAQLLTRSKTRAACPRTRSVAPKPRTTSVR
jgi:hypothetical protein